MRSQENELTSKKQELEGLKQEEARLEQLQEESRKMLDNLAKKLQDSQLQISQVSYVLVFMSNPVARDLAKPPGERDFVMLKTLLEEGPA